MSWFLLDLYARYVLAGVSHRPFLFAVEGGTGQPAIPDNRPH